MSLLVIDGLSVTYGRTAAVRNLSMYVDESEVVAIVGPNGAGKTSTLKALFGLARASSGEIAYRDQSLLGYKPEDIARRGLALVPEGRHIFQTLTVAENLHLGHAAGRGAAAELLEGVLIRFPALRQYYSESAGGLSGGEQQQLAIARALLARPELLVLDEPSLGLAPMVVDQVFTLLRELRDQGVTVLLVEQNATRAIDLADRTYVMRSGELVVHGNAGDLRGIVDLEQIYLGGAA